MTEDIICRSAEEVGKVAERLSAERRARTGNTAGVEPDYVIEAEHGDGLPTLRVTMRKGVMLEGFEVYQFIECIEQAGKNVGAGMDYFLAVFSDRHRSDEDPFAEVAA